MKKLLFVLILVIPVCVHSQTDELKYVYTHLIIYRKYLPQPMYLYNGVVDNTKFQWETQSEVFKSLKEALEYINASDGNLPYGYANIKQEELIGLYDLTTAKEIKLKFIEEKKSKPKKIEIKEEEWIEQHYEVVK